MKPIIGIPAGLYYFKYHGLWQSFFDCLGIKTVESGKTSREILDLGLKYSVNEACLPVKAYFGHVMVLKDKADYIFIPRYVSIHRGEYICPKFGALPDMIRNSLSGLPPLISPEINLRKSEKDIMKAVYDIADSLDIGRKEAKDAFRVALKEFHNQPLLKSQALTHGQPVRVLLIGHPYLIYDKYLNLGIVSKLAKLGAEVMTLEMYDGVLLREKAAALNKPVFWSYATETMGLTYHLLDVGGIDGIIYLTSFGCGIDSFVDYMMERRIKNGSRIPYFTVTIDEHAAEAGLDTRIEAFMDTVKRSKHDENNLSSYG